MIKTNKILVNKTQMGSDEIRSRFLKFFENRGHKIIPSSSLVPEGDSTTLFTGSGMQPMMPYLLGAKHPLGVRIVDFQKSFRAEDIEEVGDNRHTTFFEMLGNWSFGDYWKEEQLTWIFEFLTEQIKLDQNRLYVTVFSGGEEFDRDDESIGIWKKLFKSKKINAEYASLDTIKEAAEKGIKENERIFGYSFEKNWWSRTGTPKNMPTGEPGGFDSEVFYRFDVDHDKKYGKYCHPNCDCGQFLEIGNSVFMEYVKTNKGFEKLKQRNVDFGGGLERITAASNDDPDVFHIDSLSSIVEEIKLWTNLHEIKAERIIADHIRAATFLLSDGLVPSNTGRGYILRRLIRRASIYGRNIKLPQHFQGKISEQVIRFYRDDFFSLNDNRDFIVGEIVKEEHKFSQTLEAGIKSLKKIYSTAINGIDPENLPPGMKIENNIIRVDGKVVFDVYQTYGVPLEISQEIMSLWGLKFDDSTMREAKEYFKKHQELSRTASAGMFKGGLANHNEKTIKHHTAHHLLLAALKGIVDPNVKQRGSNITEERLRMDFTCDHKLTDEEKKKMEDWVNDKIKQGLNVVRKEMPLKEAEKIEAEMEFGAKYTDIVSVYFIEDKVGNTISKEFCGGPHATNTRELGQFKIQKEEAVAAGIRRIKAVLN